MGEIISDKTDLFMNKIGSELIKKKFPGISIEMPMDDVSRQYVFDSILDGKPYDRIIESLIDIEQPGVRIPKTYHYFKNQFGEQVALQLLKAQENGTLTAEMFNSIVPDRNNNKSKSPNASYKDGTAQNDKQYIRIYFDVLDDPEFRQMFKGQYLTYAYLRRYIFRKPSGLDIFNLYENYFLKGKLASSCSIGFLANSLDCSPNTIRDHIKKLKKIGCIKVPKSSSKQAWNRQKQHIYLFGTHDGNRNEKYFIDDVFGTPSVPDGQGVQ